MANLIRSARLATEPHRLQLREQSRPSSPALQPEPPAITPAPPPPRPVQETGRQSSQPEEAQFANPAGSAPPPAPAPTLDPETERRLLEEARLTRELAAQLGREEGYREGLAEAQKTLLAQLEAMSRLFESVSQTLQTQINGLEDVVVTLVFEAVCRIIGSSLQDREGVVSIVREILAHVKDNEPITVRVAPGDYIFLSGDQSSLGDGYLGPTITLVPDDRVTLGGCMIETSGGSLDGRLETQLQQFKDALLSAKRQRPEWKSSGRDV